MSMTNVLFPGIMERAVMRRYLISVIGVILLITVSLSTASPADYDKGYEIGLEAYTYGLPLLVTNTTFATMTSVDVSNGTFGPVNQFNNVRSLNDPGSTEVVAPGSNGLSSIAWVDLSKEPQVLHVPEVQDHFYVLGFIDPYTNNILNLGSVNATKPGEYVISSPDQQDVSIPEGTNRINVDYHRIWIIGSTQLKGNSDTPNVTRIQDGYTLTPLSQYGTNYQPKNQTNPRTNIQYYQMPEGLDFYDMLGQQLEMFPPPAADTPALSRFAEVRIGPGKKPSQDTQLSNDTVRGLKDAIAAGPAQIKNDTGTLFDSGFDMHNGYLVGGFGQYGTDYMKRAVISQIGLGAFTSEQAIFGISYADHEKNPLNGSTNYVLHLESAPPVNEGWTLTAYDLEGRLIPNSINRYEISDKSELTQNADGSMDIYLQSEQPSDPNLVNNWLPTASGQGFEIIWRLMAPESDTITGIINGTGWELPAITAVS